MYEMQNDNTALKFADLEVNELKFEIGNAIMSLL